MKTFAKLLFWQIFSKLPAGLFLLVVLGFAWQGCTEIENQRPNSDFENSDAPLPQFDVRLDSIGTKTIRFDSIAQGGNFSLSFTPLAFGKIKIVELGKAVQIQMQGGNWKKDSTEYTICKNKKCRYGRIILENLQYKKPDTIVPIDTTCADLPFRKLNIPFNQAFVITDLFPVGQTGRIDSLKTMVYSASIQSPNATFTTQGVPVEQLWAWDTIRYQLKATNRKCWTGKIAIVLGDTCEASARNDVFNAPTGTIQLSQTDLAANDTGCNGTLGNYFIGVGTDFDETNFNIIFTPNGSVSESNVLGIRQFSYQRSNAAATSDQFTYYFKNKTSNRVTKATVKIIF